MRVSKGGQPLKGIPFLAQLGLKSGIRKGVWAAEKGESRYRKERRGAAEISGPRI